MTQGLEVRFKWHSVHQYRPVPLWLVREIWKARPMNMTLQELVMNNPRFRFDEVRTEGKLLVSLLRGWQVLSAPVVRRIGTSVLPYGSLTIPIGVAMLATMAA